MSRNTVLFSPLVGLHSFSSNSIQNYAHTVKDILPSFQTTNQYVAQFSYGPSFRTKRTLFDYFRRSFKSSSNEEFQKEKEHFSYKLPVLPGFLTKKQVSADNFFRGE